jgi:lipid II isoglutaminyl synthase (glutamine-hydrolysing)|tara:strand:+ start:854 stop:2272 length:1419 start_codon:yes stop_codon:yes gene_type:complete
MIYKYFVFFLAIQIKSLLRILRISGGTALPGLIIERFYPKVLDELASNFSKKIIVISGTNGKTSTTNILKNIVSNNHISVISNYSGSNLKRGIISAYLDSLNTFGKFVKNNSLIILEIDEAILPEICEKIRPSTILLLNLFRDQLDRYGEIDKIREKWLLTFSNTMFEHSQLHINADDYLLSDVAQNFAGSVHYYGVDDPLLEDKSSDPTIENHYCHCGKKISHSVRYYAHVGKWQCDDCGNQRIIPTTIATNIRQDLNSVTFNLNSKNESHSFTSSSIGLFSVYNAVAAFSIVLNLGMKMEHLVKGFSSENNVFGRQEAFIIDQKRVKLFLVKNPAGLNQVIYALTQKNHYKNTSENKLKKLNILFALNNRVEDGKDVSWIYDADIERLSDHTNLLVISGIRADDLALRFVMSNRENIMIEKDLKNSVKLILSKSPPNSDIYLLLTYSAMMKYRKYFAKISGSKPFWVSST